MCTSTLSAGPPIRLPLGQTLIPAKPNPQPVGAGTPPGSKAQAAVATPPAASGDPNRGQSLNIAV